MPLWLLCGLTVSAKPRWEAGHGELPFDLGNELLPLEPSAGFVRIDTEVAAVDSGTICRKTHCRSLVCLDGYPVGFWLGYVRKAGYRGDVQEVLPNADVRACVAMPTERGER